ncbi:hypothetical protein B0H13DRAFT_2355236 [Mycena leptocephala]|nr:hypothetical protein B0H13DRAFT_2355236 [Mycena leptocephala]
MLTFKLLKFFILPFVLGGVMSTPATVSAPEIRLISTASSASAVQNHTGDTRVYYQNTNDKSIHEIAVLGTFSSGTFEAEGSLIPANEVLFGTPIVAVSANPDGPELFQDIHVFFVSPTNILSSYVWQSSTGWLGGSSCAPCITSSTFGVQAGSKLLYAMANGAAGSPALLRVGFVSAGATSTLSEATFTAAAGWRLAQIP